MLRVLHVVLAGSLAAEPVERDYAGILEVEVEARPEPREPPKPVATPEPALVPEGPEDEEEDEGDEVPYDPLVDSPEAIQAKGWVRSGAVFVAIGAVLGIGGIAMATAPVNTLTMQNVCDPRGDVAGNGCQEGARNRAALTLGLPGVLLLAAGTAMLIVGKRQQKRLRASLQAGRRDLGITLQFAF